MDFNNVMCELVECFSFIDDDRRTGLEKFSFSVRFFGWVIGGCSGDWCGCGGVFIFLFNFLLLSMLFEIVVFVIMLFSSFSSARLFLASDWNAFLLFLLFIIDMFVCVLFDCVVFVCKVVYFVFFMFVFSGCFGIGLCIIDFVGERCGTNNEDIDFFVINVVVIDECIVCFFFIL